MYSVQIARAARRGARRGLYHCVTLGGKAAKLSFCSFDDVTPIGQAWRFFKAAHQ
jgi:hypothetical protein